MHFSYGMLLHSHSRTFLSKTDIVDIGGLVGDGRGCAIEFRDVDREWLVVRLGPILQDAERNLFA